MNDWPITVGTRYRLRKKPREAVVIHSDERWVVYRFTDEREWTCTPAQFRERFVRPE